MTRFVSLSIASLAVALLLACGETPAVPDGGGEGAPPDTDPGVSPIWDVVSHHAPVMDLAWSPGEEFIAVFARHTPLTVLHAGNGTEVDWRTGTSWRPAGCALIGAISWSPDGRHIALPGTVIDTETWSPSATLTMDVGHTSDALAFSPDGALLAGGSRPRGGGQEGVSLVVWDTATGERVVSLEARGYIGGIAWSPDGQRVLTTSWWGESAVYDLGTSSMAFTLPDAASATWSPDGARIAFAHTYDLWVGEGVPGVVSLMDAASGEVLLERSVSDVAVHSVAWHPSGERIVVGDADGVVSSLAADTLEVRERQTVLGPAGVVRVGTEGRTVAVGTAAGHVHLRPAPLDVPGLRVPIGQSDVLTAVWSPDGRYLASGGVDGVVKVRHAADGAVATELPVRGGVQAVAWSPDGRWLVLGGRAVTVYDAESWEVHGSVPAVAWPRSLAFGLNGTDLAVLDYRAVHLVDVLTLEITSSFHLSDMAGETVYSPRLAWSPAGTAMAIADGGNVWILRLESADMPAVERSRTPFTEVPALAYADNGSMLVMGGPSVATGEQRVVVMDAVTFEVVRDELFAGERGSVATVGFTASDRWFWAAGSTLSCCGARLPPGERDALKAWNVADGARTFGIEASGRLGATAFSPEGDRVVVGRGGRLAMWVVR